MKELKGLLVGFVLATVLTGVAWGVINKFDIVDLTTGLRIGGAAASGKYLRGDGTNFVSGDLNVGDAAAGTLAVARGGTNLTGATDDNVMVGNGTTWESKALPSCSNGTTDKLLYNNTTNAFSCGTDQSGAGAGAGVFLTWSANQAVQAGTGTLAPQDTRNGHPVLDMDAAADECGYFHGVLANDYASGGLTVDLFWMATSATSGDVVWRAAIERHDTATDLDADSFASDQSVTTTTGGTSGTKAKSAITFTNGAQMDSLAAGEPFRLRVCRDADHGSDTMAGDAELANVSMRET